MVNSPWPLSIESEPQTEMAWLPALLARNSETAYLRAFGSPDTVEAFRSRVPLCQYADLEPYLRRLQAGESDVLFAGRPVAYERTGGSSDGHKLIPYSREGLLDFQLNIEPWLAETMARHQISGRVYFSISPATRQVEFVGEVPVGLSDAAFLGEHAGRLLAERTAVPLDIGTVKHINEWQAATIRHLRSARDLELISVWSPTFLLRLLRHIPDAKNVWPRLKVVSCWASGPSRRYAEEVARLLPQAEIQPKGLLSTEAVVTVPDERGHPVLARHGFCEFAQGEAIFLEDGLFPGETYEVIVTTASGLYRYRTGDFISYRGRSAQGRPVLDFVGRSSLTCDLVGEKLTEPFVGRCLDSIPGFAMMVPDVTRLCYVLLCEMRPTAEQRDLLESRLQENPQYAYARKLGQLGPLKVLAHPLAASAYEREMLRRGARLGDLKPVALRKEAFWVPFFEETLQ